MSITVILCIIVASIAAIGLIVSLLMVAILSNATEVLWCQKLYALMYSTKHHYNYQYIKKRGIDHYLKYGDTYNSLPLCNSDILLIKDEFGNYFIEKVSLSNEYHNKILLSKFWQLLIKDIISDEIEKGKTFNKSW